MGILFRCPECGHETIVASQYIGQAGPCVACGQMVTVRVVHPTSSRNSPTTTNPKRLPIWLKRLLILASLLLVGTTFVGVFVSLISPAFQASATASRRSTCQLQLRQLAAAMHAYHKEHGHFPPAFTTDDSGRPLLSWRVAILPYLGPEAIATYRQIALNEPWNSPNNARAAASIPSLFRCPEDKPFGPADTSYCVVTGKGFLFDRDLTTAQDDVTDGLGNTVMIVEVSESGIHWMEPKDITANAWAFGVNGPNPQSCRSHHAGGVANVAFADTLIRPLMEATSPEDLQAMATIAGGEQISVLPR